MRRPCNVPRKMQSSLKNIYYICTRAIKSWRFRNKYLNHVNIFVSGLFSNLLLGKLFIGIYLDNTLNHRSDVCQHDGESVGSLRRLQFWSIVCAGAIPRA